MKQFAARGPLIIPDSGWPDDTNTGYLRAPGYPGSLTTWPGTIITTDNQTYSFFDMGGGISVGPLTGSNVNNIEFYGCKFNASGASSACALLYGDNIRFRYCTFEPTGGGSYRTLSRTAGYQYAIEYDSGGAGVGGTHCGQLLVDHCNIWGFANAVDGGGSTQAKPQVFQHNWLHHPRDDAAGADHTDGICDTRSGGYVSSYVVIYHNTIIAAANTQGIGYQEGTYSHFTITNNLFSGWNQVVEIGNNPNTSIQPSFITFANNTYSTILTPWNGGNLSALIYNNFYDQTGGIWNNNKWLVPPGAAWGNPAHNGYYWVPTTATWSGTLLDDTQFVSITDVTKP